MKSFRLLIIITVFSILVPSCQKPNEEIKDQKSLLFNEQANPGVKGELQVFTYNGSKIYCELINGKYIFQGDMILTEDQLSFQGSAKGTGLESFVNRWTNNTVLYRISDDLPDQSRVTDAIKYWEEKTPLKFLELDELIENLPNTHGWEIPKGVVSFIWDKDGCYSNVGMIGNEDNVISNQDIGLADWADKGTVIHEIGHTVGLLHEHSRLDRDEYITVNLENVESGKEHNFDIVEGKFNTSNFDFNSVMLFSSYAFSKNGLPTITKSDGSTYEAQREVLSEGDINVINMIYLTPQVSIIRTANITDQSVTLQFDVTSNREANVMETGIYLGASADPEKTGNKSILGNETGKMTTTLTGLSPNTKFYVRGYATNNAGTSYGIQVSFTTYGVMDADGNGYKTIKIGDQEWTVENLRTTMFSDGQLIPQVINNTNWGGLTTPAYCWYNNDTIFKPIFGALYNWHAVNTGKLCPAGWHVPTNTEWNTLITYLGGEIVAGGKLKESGTLHWESPNTGATNETGFTFLPGGIRTVDYGFISLWTKGDLWSATESQEDANNAWSLGFSYDNSASYLTYCCWHLKTFGRSVRCLKD